MNQILRTIFDEDQSDRKNSNISKKQWIQINKNDLERKKLVQEMINKKLLKDSMDYYHASFIFQHGDGSKDFLKANKLAKKSVDLGNKKAKWIYAATFDRYLRSIGKLQKYGTQYKIDKKGNWILEEIDSGTSDKERIEHGLKPIAQIPKFIPSEQ